MQFMPATWKAYGVDGNKDGLADPYNPVDAIFAAARYLKAAGADKDLRAAVCAYNHADWYVDSVLLRAQVIGGMPTSLVSSLTGLTEGRFPVAAKATYADEIDRRGPQEEEAQERRRRRRTPNRRGALDLRRRRLAGGRGQRRPGDQDRRLRAPRPLHPGPGRVRQHVHLRAPGEDLPALRRAQAAEGGPGRGQAPAGRSAPKDKKPKRAASGTDRPGAEGRPPSRRATDAVATDSDTAAPVAAGRGQGSACSRNPTRANAAAAGGAQQEFLRTGPHRRRADARPARSASGATRSSSRTSRRARRCPAGTVLGRIGTASSKKHPHVRFEIRPAGRGAPRVDPKPILDGWKLLESTAIYRAQGENPFVGADAAPRTVGQILLMGKETLIQRVLDNPKIHDLRLRAPGHPGGRDRPPRARDARVPGRQRLQPDDLLAALRPLVPDRLGQRVRALDRQRRGHRRDQRRGRSPGPPGQGLDHRAA